MKEGLTDQILKFIIGRRDTVLEDLEKSKKRSLAATVNDEELEAVEKDYLEQESAVMDQFEPRAWISRAARKSCQISIATHVVKFTHGRAQGTNILCTDYEENPRFLDSGTIRNPYLDVTGNANALDVAKLLMVEHDGVTLLHTLQQGDISALSLVAQDEAEAIAWAEQLMKATEDKEPSTHQFAKQVFWPTENGDYHLLGPLTSSSLIQEIHGRISEARYSQTSVDARKAKRNNAMSDVPVTYYPNMASMMYGGANKQNISLGNAGRRGLAYMMPNMPPVWESQDTPPYNLPDVFESRAINRFNYRTIKAFSLFLDKVTTRDSNKSIRDTRDSFVEQLVDTILNFGLKHSRFEQGWSLSCNLPFHQRVWLDPACPEYKDEIITGDWIVAVANDFAEWLNGKLNELTEKQNIFGDPEHLEWQKQMKQGLKDLQRRTR